MRFAGQVFRSGKYWAIEVPILSVVTQGRTKTKAFEMNADAIETLVNLDSTPKCNCQGGMCGEEYFIRCSKAKCLSWPMIEPLHRFLDLFSGNTCQLPGLGKVLPNQHIRVLIYPSLP